MKEVEKLAREFAQSESLKGVMGEDEPCYVKGYEAGFIRAREMAILWTDGFSDGCGCCANSDAGKVLEKLGEEEVK